MIDYTITCELKEINLEELKKHLPELYKPQKAKVTFELPHYNVTLECEDELIDPCSMGVVVKKIISDNQKDIDKFHKYLEGDG